MSDRRWLGRAVAQADKQKVVFTGTWSAGDTVTATINGKALVLTLGATVTLIHVANAFAAMWNGSAVVVDETRNAVGNDFTDFDEISASSNGIDTVTLTHDTAGVPFTVAVSDVSAGTATLSSVQSPTGPNFVDNVNNWSGGSLPVNADRIFFDKAANGPKFALTALAAVTPALVDVSPDATYHIGLPILNATGSYTEYRPRYLQLNGATLCRVRYGSGGSGSPLLRFDFLATAVAIEVQGTGSSYESSAPAFNFLGTNANNTLDVNGGTVGAGFFSGELTTVKTTTQGGGTITCGPDVTLNGASSTITMSGGTFRAVSALITLTVDGGTAEIDGSATCTTVTINSGGTVRWKSSGTITTLSYAGVIDFSGDRSAVIVTSATGQPGGVMRGARRATLTAFAKNTSVDTITCA